MELTDLQNQSNIFFRALQQMPQDGASLHEKLFLAYNQWVCQKTIQMLETNTEPSLLATNLTAFLHENWALVNGSCLCPTAIPDADVTQLLIAVAQFITDNTPASENLLTPLQYLMPTVECESIRDNYLSLNAIPVPNVLGTHILGRQGLYLLPVQLLTEIDLDNRCDSTKLSNPYYDGEHETYYHTNADEFERLINHNDQTKTLGEALQRFNVLSNDQSSLLGQLQQLCRHLQLNSANNGGQGTESNAASGAYAPIIQFNDYYTQLDEALKSTIPPDLKREIELLLELASNPKININATSTMATCIATRKEKLINAMRDQESTLSNITLKQELKTNLVAIAKADFIRAQAALNLALGKKQCVDGRDCLPLNLKLLKTLNVPLEINNMSDLNALGKLNVQELAEVLTEPHIKQSIIRTLDNLEGLIMYLMDTSTDTIAVLMHHCTKEIIESFIRNHNAFSSAKNLSALLITLSVEKCAAVIEAIKEQLPTIIRDVYDLNNVLKDLSTEQRTVVFESMQECLPRIIKNPYDFKTMLGYLTPEQRTVVFESMQEYLPSIIKNGNDFKTILEYLTPEQRTVVFEAIQPQLSSIIKDVNDFNKVLEELNPIQLTIVLDAIQPQLSSIIKDVFDLNKVLEELNPIQLTIVLDAIQPQLSSIIKDVFDFTDVLVDLTVDKHAIVFDAIKTRLSTIIKDTLDFNKVLKELPPKQRSVVFKTVKTQLSSIIKNVDDFNRMLESLTPDERAIISEDLQPLLSSIITNVSDFNEMLEYLTPNERVIIFEDVQQWLPRIIKDVYDFNRILESLTPDERIIVLEDVQPLLSSIIKEVFEFNDVLEYLTPNERIVICKNNKKLLSGIIDSVSNFEVMLEHLTPDERVIIFEDVQQWFPRIIKDVYDFNRILESLTPDERIVICKNSKTLFSGIIDSAYHFKDVLKNLTPDERAIVFKDIQPLLSSVIKEVFEFNDVLEYLTPEQCITMFLIVKTYLPSVIYDVKSVFDELTTEHQLMIITSVTQTICPQVDHEKYQRLWELPLATNHGKTVEPALLSAAQILQNYMEIESTVKPIGFFSQPRRPVFDVTPLIREIEKGELTQKQLIEKLILIVNSQGINLDDSLFQRVGFIASQLQKTPSTETDPDLIQQFKQ